MSVSWNARYGYLLRKYTIMFEQDQLTDENTTEEQLNKLEGLVHGLLVADPSFQFVNIEDEAYEKVDEVIRDGLTYDDSIGQMNEQLKDEQAELFFQLVDQYVNDGILPETHGEAYQVVHNAVWEATERLHDEINVDEWEVQQIQNEMDREENEEYEQYGEYLSHNDWKW